MELAIKISVIIHIVAGAIALLSGIVAIVSKKGKSVHLLTGKIYAFCMTIIFITAMFLSIIKGRWFLFFIGVFSFYQVVLGYRALAMKQHKSTLFDKALSFSIFIGGIAALIYGWLTGIQLFMIFGGLGSLLAGSNLFRFLSKKEDKLLWIKRHIAGMLGGFIATSTAFLITIAETQLGIWTWILPTIIGTPLIVYYLRQYKTDQ